MEVVDLHKGRVRLNKESAPPGVFGAGALPMAVSEYRRVGNTWPSGYGLMSAALSWACARMGDVGGNDDTK